METPSWLGEGMFAAAGGAFVWIYNEIRKAKIGRDALEHRADENTLAIAHHRDELTFSLLDAAQLQMAGAKLELESLRVEITHLRRLEHRFAYFDEAVHHLRTVVEARVAGTPQAAERNASQFLVRMERVDKEYGEAAGKEQARRAKQSIKSAIHGNGPILTQKDI